MGLGQAIIDALLEAFNGLAASNKPPAEPGRLAGSMETAAVQRAQKNAAS